jgi:hypothetical protein
MAKEVEELCGQKGEYDPERIATSAAAMTVRSRWALAG